MVKNTWAKSSSTEVRKVREIARSLEKQGYEVRVQARGREKPRRIGSKNLIPDIEATGHGRRLIIEVKTPATFARDKEQLKVFAQHARQKANTTLRVVVTKPRR